MQLSFRDCRHGVKRRRFELSLVLLGRAIDEGSGVLLSQSIAASSGEVELVVRQMLADGLIAEVRVEDMMLTWRGFAVKPRNGSWKRLRRHFEEVLAAGNEEHADYLIRWSFWVLQHPTERAEVVVVLGGKKGVGKGMWAARVMSHLFGANAIHVSDRKHLAGNFNAHLLQCCMLFGDECFWPGDRDKDGPLKRMITEPTLLIEPKGVDAFQMKNRLSMIIAGNEDWLVPASSDERRYAVFEVSDKYQRDTAYFNPLLAELDGGGLAAFLHDALAADLGDWHPRDNIPQTDALSAQQQVSAMPEVQWLGALLDEGMLPFSVRDGGVEKRLVHPKHPDWARTQMLFVHATSRPGMSRWTGPQFYRFLDDHGIGFKKRLSEGAYRQFPPLPAMRKAWRAKHPWWPEFHEPDMDWAMPVDETQHRDIPAGDWSHRQDETPF